VVCVGLSDGSECRCVARACVRAALIVQSVCISYSHNALLFDVLFAVASTELPRRRLRCWPATVYSRSRLNSAGINRLDCPTHKPRPLLLPPPTSHYLDHPYRYSVSMPSVYLLSVWSVITGACRPRRATCQRIDGLTSECFVGGLISDH